jgi:hypothetical protein
MWLVWAMSLGSASPTVAAHTAAPVPTVSGQIPIDRIVAVVDKEVLTESRLLTEARLSLAWREGPQAAQVDLAPKLLDVLRAWIIDQMLIASQARRLGSDDVSEEQTAAREATLIQRFASQAQYDTFLTQFGITRQAVHDTMARDLRCEHYMEQRMRTRLVGSTQAKTVEPGRYAAAVKLWLEELRQSAEVRLEGPDGSLELERSR